MLAPAAGATADLILQRDASRGHRAKPLIRYLQRRKDGAGDVREALEKLRSEQSGDAVELNKILDREIGYFDRHKNRMDYKDGKSLG